MKRSETPPMYAERRKPRKTRCGISAPARTVGNPEHGANGETCIEMRFDARFVPR